MTAAQRWWRDAVIYQVYPRSFADSDGDGMGDLPGITQHLEHVAELGADAVWLSPFYLSPQHDAGYDVADYRAVDPRFGTLADADALIARAAELGLRVIVDLVPNHTSDEHAWFQEALRSVPGSPARHRYVFRDGRGEHGELPPNNWRSTFGGPAWTRVSERPDATTRTGTDAQWYLHLFDSTQPDLNWDDPQVRAEFEDVLRFWLRRGVAGFRVDVAHGLVKAPGLPDWDGAAVMAEAEATVEGDGTAEGEAGPGPAPMFDQEGVHQIYRSWRRVLDEFGEDRVLVAEAWVEPLERLARYVRPGEMQQAFNFSYLSVRWDPAQIRTVIDRSLAAMGEVGATATWVLSNHDVIRHASRFGLDYPGARPNGVRAQDPQPDPARGLRRAMALTLQMLALPGSAYLYQGEELGLPEHTSLADHHRQDPSFFRTAAAEAGRDGCRIPMPWQHDAPALGFSPTGALWLPQPEPYQGLAADLQHGDPASPLERYRRAIMLRRGHGLGAGRLRWLPQGELPPGRDDVLAFWNGPVLVVTVTGSEPLRVAGADLLVASTASPLQQQGEAWTVPAETTAWFVPRVAAGQVTLDAVP